MDHNHHYQPPSATATTTTNPDPSRSEAERLLGIAEKLLQSRDLTGSREFALLAQETESLLEGSDQILAITEVLLASEKRVNNNRHHDWYTILQSDRRSDPDQIKKNYRRLALLLHPDKNNYPLADSAFKLVADAWTVLSDPAKKAPYDKELSLYTKLDLRSLDKDKLPVRRSSRGGGGGVDGPHDDDGYHHHHHDGPGSNATPPPHAATGQMNANQNIHRSRGGVGGGAGRGAGERMANFWTACPYCYVLYEYPRAYKECCIRCQNCERAFHAAAIPSMPPMVPGKEAYYCCWGFFPLGFSLEGSGKGKKGGEQAAAAANNNNNNNAGSNADGGAAAANNNNGNMGFPNWMPGMFTSPMAAATPQGANVNRNMNNNNNNMPNVVNMNAGVSGMVDLSDGSASGGFVNAMPAMSAPGAKKRGRPRKNPMAL